ncbi:MAG: hypothetical protein ABSB63_22610 [Spirochaetia bacterium]|jgi:hypothetical protein
MVDGVDYSVYRSGNKLVQVCHAIEPKAFDQKEITTGTFDVYLAKARENPKKN